MTRIAIVAAILTLAACATGSRVMSEAECLSADWAAFGYEDGVAGAPPGLGSDRAAACQPYAVRMDRAAYDAGRTRGLASFCSPPRGYRMGADGVPYRGQCADHDEAAFTTAWEQGWTLFGYTDAVDRAAYRLAALEAEREGVRTELARLAAGAVSLPVPEAAARTAWLVQAESRLSDRDIPAARDDLWAARRALDAHRAAGPA